MQALLSRYSSKPSHDAAAAGGMHLEIAKSIADPARSVDRTRAQEVEMWDQMQQLPRRVQRPKPRQLQNGEPRGTRKQRITNRSYRHFQRRGRIRAVRAIQAILGNARPAGHDDCLC